MLTFTFRKTAVNVKTEENAKAASVLCEKYHALTAKIQPVTIR